MSLARIGLSIDSFDVFVWAVIVAWTMASAALIRRLRVFDSSTLAAAPPRHSQFTFVHVGAVVLVYLGVLVCLSPLVPEGGASTSPAAARSAAPASAPSLAVQSAPSTGSAVATAAIAAPATTSGPSTTRHAGTTTPAATTRGNGANFTRLQINDAIGKLVATAALILLASRLMINRMQGFGLSGAQLVPGIALGLLASATLAPWMVLVNAATHYVSEMVRYGPPPVHPLLQAMGTHPSFYEAILFLVAALAIAPLAEEALFRGLVQTVLLRLGRLVHGRAAGIPLRPDDPTFVRASSVPPTASAGWRWLTILVSSALFTSVHVSGGNYEVIPPLFLLALFLAYLYERTGNLWAPITLHFLFNTVSTVSFLYATQGPSVQPL